MTFLPDAQEQRTIQSLLQFSRGRKWKLLPSLKRLQVGRKVPVEFKSEGGTTCDKTFLAPKHEQ